MHYIIDDFVWIAIGLTVVAILFMVGALYIFLDEGIRRLVRSFREPANVTIPNSASQTAKPDSVSLRTIGNLIRSTSVKPHSSTDSNVWHKIQSKIHEAKSGTYLLLHHIGHHRPANVKP